MTTDHDLLPAGLTRHIESWVRAFNSGDAQRVHELYDDEAVLVPRPGLPMTGTGRAAAVEHLLGFGVSLEAHLRHAYVAGDVALLVVDWSLRGTARDGTSVDMGGTATDVVRRGPDDSWRYLVDNPFGTAGPAGARPGQ